jgi:lysophospholipid acyltransferase (LPLAT)-like uncharacterized protein
MKGGNIANKMAQGFPLQDFALFNDTRTSTALWTSRWSLTGSYRAKRLDSSVLASTQRSGEAISRW